MKCLACDAPLDDDIDLCDECFRVMPMDRMMSPSEIRQLAAFVKTLERVCSDPPEAATEGFGYGVAS